MKTKFSIGLLLSVIAISPVFGNINSVSANNTTITNQQVAAQTDASILNWLVVLNQNEIAAANLALTKSPSSAVQQYAQMMIKDHTKALQDTLALSKNIDITPVQTPMVVELKTGGEQEFAKLKPLTGNAFQQAYITAMVNGHTDALNTIDNTLLKDVSNSQLKTFLTATRSVVDAHLQAAKKIQNELQGS